jgi:hypothetical protein
MTIEQKFAMKYSASLVPSNASKVRGYIAFVLEKPKKERKFSVTSRVRESARCYCFQSTTNRNCDCAKALGLKGYHAKFSMYGAFNNQPMKDWLSWFTSSISA